MFFIVSDKKFETYRLQIWLQHQKILQKSSQEMCDSWRPDVQFEVGETEAEAKHFSQPNPEEIGEE